MSHKNQPPNIIENHDERVPTLGNDFEIPNDGSFLEKFKKFQENAKLSTSQEKKISPHSSQSEQTPVVEERVSESSPSHQPSMVNKAKGSMISKRRMGGGRLLKTGVVEKKAKTDDDSNNTGKDGWSKYMSEVEKYKMVCTSDDNTRPLIK